MYIALIIFAVIIAWITLITLASLLAVVPFFLVGAAAKLGDVLAERRRTRRILQAERTRWKKAAWIEAEKNYPSLFETPMDRLQESGWAP